MTLIKRSTSGFPNLFEDIFGKEFFDTMPLALPGSTIPAVNIKENNEGFEIELAAPGMSKEDFKIELENNVMSISSEKEHQHEEMDKEGRYTRREFSMSSFRRSFTLPDSVNNEKIDAGYKNGILKISVPKMESAKAKPNRMIAIK